MIFAGALSSMLWFFDSIFHWMWWIGMNAFAFTSVLLLLPIALFYRYLEDRRAYQAVACAVVLALNHMVHPYCFMV